MLTKIISAVACFSLTFFVGYANSGDAEASSPREEKKKSQSVESRPSVQSSRSKPGVLANLRGEHPRLLFTKADQRRIEKLAGSNPLLADLIVQLNYNSEQMLKQPTIRFKVDACKNILEQSRACLARVMTLSMSYRLTGDTRFFERARKEMLAAAAMKNWNPKHFLDVAEMSCALAIGYDWLYDALSKADRATIRSAIVTKGLEAGMEAYRERKHLGWWANCPHNWNQVCNGGLVLASLAVAEDEPALAGKVISQALRSIPRALAGYRPDGVGNEGPTYWTYGTTYTGLTIAALDSALGDDFGLSKAEGLDKTGDYRIHTIRPNGTFFNYSDGGLHSGISPVMFWLARKFNRPAHAWFERQQLRRIFARQKRNGKYGIRSHRPARLYAMEIAWFDERGDLTEVDNWPLDLFFGGIGGDVVTMRGAWGDKGALYVGFKGGSPQAGHRHLDVGTFVLDADGVSWAIEIGGDKYTLPGYWDWHENARRWKYYRLSSKGHNTLVIDGKNQRAGENIGKVIDFLSTADRTHAVIDMSRAYGGQAEKVLRGVAMLNRSRVLIQDEITAPAGEVRWGMLTETKIRLDGKKATLTKDGKTLLAEILAPAGARFKIVTPPTPGKGERLLPKNLSMLAIFIKPTEGKQKPVRLAVMLTPIGKKWKKLPSPKPRPLNNWAGHAKK